MADRVLVCVAWPYANGPLHLGHVAGSLLPPDIFARYQRMRGADVAMVSGSDMHGTPITVAAEKAGETPEAFAEKNRLLHNAALKALSIHFDLFTSTATANHRDTVHELFRTLLANGLIDQRAMTAPYDAKAKRFLPDRYVEGTCPHCGFADARGDQCDSCGRTLDPQELKDPRSKLTGTPPEYRETEHFFLRLDLLQPDLETWVASQKLRGSWRPSVVNFTEQWLKEGLKPRAITRDLTYGVTIPVDAGAPALRSGHASSAATDPAAPALRSGHASSAATAADAGSYPDKRIYVWFEAVTGYLSATRELLPNDWRRFWDPAQGAKHHYFLGKDNIPFHTIIWPAMLLGNDRKPGALGALQTPWDVPANEFLQFAGAKFSKSRGNAFYVLDLLTHFDADQVRYYLTVNMPEKGDTDWTWPDFVAKVNDELANTLGNYVNRVLSFTANTFDGKAPAAPAHGHAQAQGDDTAIAKALENAGASLAAARFKDALRDVMTIARLGNQRMQENAPWALVKAGKRDEAAAVLAWHLGTIKTLAVALQPFLPSLSDEIWTQLGEKGPSPRALAEKGDGRDHWPAHRLTVAPGQAFGAIKPLVKKLDIKAVMEEFAMDNKTTTTTPGPGPAQAPAPGKPQITIDDFAKLDLRVAKVLSCEPHPKADKIWVLQVDLGHEKRQILAGLREHVTPEEIVGKKIVVIANLAPRQIRGLESQGMVLAAEESGVVSFLTPAKDVPQGAGIK
ncbi:MAG TPA: methionine--tRNA ligase [Candidatus Thermoplasmatota archaeon]|nr:methionine--tRNA ligase [Candidatus Thermoplasmatota archaeon]